MWFGLFLDKTRAVGALLQALDAVGMQLTIRFNWYPTVEEHYVLLYRKCTRETIAPVLRRCIDRLLIRPNSKNRLRTARFRHIHHKEVIDAYPDTRLVQPLKGIARRREVSPALEFHRGISPSNISSRGTKSPASGTAEAGGRPTGWSP